MILAVGDRVGVCPDCEKQSERRHGWHERHLQDLPAQGAAVTVKLRIQRWQCRNKACKRQTFDSQLPEIAAPLARRTARAAELVHLFGHGVGGRPGERLLKRIGMPTSDDTILRHLKRRVKARLTTSSRSRRLVHVPIGLSERRTNPGRRIHESLHLPEQRVAFGADFGRFPIDRTPMRANVPKCHGGEFRAECRTLFGQPLKFPAVTQPKIFKVRG